MLIPAKWIVFRLAKQARNIHIIMCQWQKCT